MTRTRRWVRTGARLALTAAAIAGALAIDLGALGALAFVFILVVPFEKFFPRHPQRLRRPEIGTDLAFALMAPLLNVIGLGVGLVVAAVSLLWVPGLALRPVVAMIPSALLPVVALVIFDFVLYWTHRFAHEVPLLWRFHAIHHSTRTLDWVSGFRSHPLDGVLLAPAFAFVLAAGFDLETTGLITVLQIAVGLFLHANVRWRLGPLRALVATPEFHHWHHADETGARSSNYAALLPIWDRWFGTWFMPADRRPQVYGIAEPVPATVLGLLRHPLPTARRILQVARRPIARGLPIVATVLRGMRRSIRQPLRHRLDVADASTSTRRDLIDV